MTETMQAQLMTVQLITAQLMQATQCALNGHWDDAHNIAQNYHDPIAYWLHAVLHKVEGDQFNSEYWYAKTKTHRFSDYSDTTLELNAILTTLKT